MIFFKENKYSKTYLSVVSKAISENRNRQSHGYLEKHHVIPYSILPNSFVVLLSAKEHFICHLLLLKMCISKRDYYRMLNAFQLMAHTRNIGRCTSAMYSKLKNQIADAKRELNTGEGNPFYGKKHNQETRQKLSEGVRSRGWRGERNPNFGRRWTDEQKHAASELKKNISEETRRKIGQSSKGKTLSLDHRRKIGLSLIGRKFSEQSKEKLRVGKLGDKNPNFGKRYDQEYKDKMSDLMKLHQRNILITKAKQVYSPVIGHYGSFTEDNVNSAKANGIINKYSMSFGRVVEILGLSEPNLF